LHVIALIVADQAIDSAAVGLFESISMIVPFALCASELSSGTPSSQLNPETAFKKNKFQSHANGCIVKK
jgi:hypothetical protein